MVWLVHHLKGIIIIALKVGTTLEAKKNRAQARTKFPPSNKKILYETLLRPLAVPKRLVRQFRDHFKLVERARPALSDDANKNRK